MLLGDGEPSFVTFMISSLFSPLQAPAPRRAWNTFPPAAALSGKPVHTAPATGAPLYSAPTDTA